jgi:hypothetical protein
MIAEQTRRLTAAQRLTMEQFSSVEIIFSFINCFNIRLHIFEFQLFLLNKNTIDKHLDKHLQSG